MLWLQVDNQVLCVHEQNHVPQGERVATAQARLGAGMVVVFIFDGGKSNGGYVVMLSRTHVEGIYSLDDSNGDSTFKNSLLSKMESAEVHILYCLGHT